MTNITITDPFASIFSIRAALYNATVIIDLMHRLNKDNDASTTVAKEGINTLKDAEKELDKLKDWLKVNTSHMDAR